MLSVLNIYEKLGVNYFVHMVNTLATTTKWDQKLNGYPFSKT